MEVPIITNEETLVNLVKLVQLLHTQEQYVPILERLVALFYSFHSENEKDLCYDFVQNSKTAIFSKILSTSEKDAKTLDFFNRVACAYWSQYLSEYAQDHFDRYLAVSKHIMKVFFIEVNEIKKSSTVPRAEIDSIFDVLIQIIYRIPYMRKRYQIYLTRYKISKYTINNWAEMKRTKIITKS
jgi:hypothetical protein